MSMTLTLHRKFHHGLIYPVSLALVAGVISSARRQNTVTRCPVQWGGSAPPSAYQGNVFQAQVRNCLPVITMVIRYFKFRNGVKCFARHDQLI